MPSAYETWLTKCAAEETIWEDDALACAPYLYEQIEVVQPAVILAAGREVAQVLGAKSTKRWRGRRFDYNGIPVVTTFDPAILAVVPEAIDKIEKDIASAIRTGAQEVHE